MAPTPGISSGVGAAARVERSNALDAWLATLLPDLPVRPPADRGDRPGAAADRGDRPGAAADRGDRPGAAADRGDRPGAAADRGDRPGAALVAVGGLGRREMAPYSDIDLVLVHTEDCDIDPAQVWYPIWDAGFKLDHSARTQEQALEVADTDVKAALGLLDARLLAGDRDLAKKLHDAIVIKWRRDAHRILPMLRELTEQRWERYGELAFLLEGDLKEAHGGLRDVGVLRGLGYAGVADGTRPAVRAAHNFLLDVRDALHNARGRRGDHLLAQERSEVARELELADGDALLRRITESARTIAQASDDAWRATTRWLSRREHPRAEKTRTPLARDVIEQDGEAVLARTAVTAKPDPALALRVAAAAARSGRPIARPTLEWLARYAQPPTRPWPPGARYAFFALLGAGPGLVPTWEACDRYGLVTGWLPEWARIRSAPQHNPVHRFTIDRHLVETAANAAVYAREVSRPDLLVLCALLHDIGKGLPGDHSVVGAPIAAGVAERIGLPQADVEIVERVVRQHLLLPDTATRRDLGDPITIDMVAEAVRDPITLDLLYALARADAFATGPAAWSGWKGRLVDELVRRVGGALAGRAPEPPPAAPPRPDGPLPAVRVTTERVTVTAQDRRGLLAAVAGCLALHRLEVMTADTSTVDKLAYVSCAVQPRFGDGIDLEGVAVDLRRALAGELPLGRRLAPRPSGDARLMWHPATDAAVLEVRAADSPGLLYSIASALENVGADVRAARISTLGAAVVDAFYLEGTDWSDDRRTEIEAAVLGAVSGGPAPAAPGPRSVGSAATGATTEGTA